MFEYVWMILIMLTFRSLFSDFRGSPSKSMNLWAIYVRVFSAAFSPLLVFLMAISTEGAEASALTGSKEMDLGFTLTSKI